jgi:hypothetical protein
MLAIVRRISVHLAVAFVAGLAMAAEPQFFGPKVFGVEAGKPKTFLESVSVNAAAFCQSKAAFILIIENDGVSSAEVLLNGRTVLSEHDFGQNRTVIEKPIDLIGQNTLSLSA